ncbi:hypothetical protein G6F63_016395 [Rhizopus arrhizus]|nr:hypothetical protein G6F63_016395 [Rhizopus arrhizus]
MGQHGICAGTVEVGQHRIRLQRLGRARAEEGASSGFLAARVQQFSDLRPAKLIALEGDRRTVRVLPLAGIPVAASAGRDFHHQAMVVVDHGRACGRGKHAEKKRHGAAPRHRSTPWEG